MKKRLLTGIIAAALIAAFAIPAFAAFSDSQKKEINNLLEQIASLRKQVVEKYVEAGKLTKEQGEQIKKNIDQATKYQKENDILEPGFGCGGPGMMGGYNMMGGFSIMGSYNVNTI